MQLLIPIVIAVVLYFILGEGEAAKNVASVFVIGWIAMLFYNSRKSGKVLPGVASRTVAPPPPAMAFPPPPPIPPPPPVPGSAVKNAAPPRVHVPAPPPPPVPAAAARPPIVTPPPPPRAPAAAAPPPVAKPPSPPPLQPPPPVPQLSFVRFTDPMAGTFTADVVQGWQVKGGLFRPGLGDRRACLEVQSPDGIFVMSGDPNCPQTFCHYPMQFEDVMVPSSTGCTFLNIPPSGKRLAAYYLKNIAPQRFPGLKITSRGDRDDIANADLKALRETGLPVPKKWKMSGHEVRFQLGGRVGFMYASTGYDPSTSMGFMTVFLGGIEVWVAPPHLTQTAEQVLLRMKRSVRFTPKLQQIVQQDEMVIASNGMAANMNQQMWFQGQQAAHNAQMAQGDAIMSNYWQQQQVNDGISASYWNAQHSYDHISQDRSDAMLGRERLYDDTLGKAYDAPAGANYYWADQHGQVIGTNTSDPPDYLNNYTPLRKAP